MTVARDSFLESTTFTTTSPFTYTGPTPVGTPASVTVFIAHGTTSSDLIDGAVTYGGVAMSRPTIGFAQDTAGEPGAVYAYFLGSGIPSGAQTVSISHNGNAAVKIAYTILNTAGTSTTAVGDSKKLEGDAANPAVSPDTPAIFSLRQSIIYSGQDSVLSLADRPGMVTTDGTMRHDFGNFVCLMGLQDTASSGVFTIGYTAISEDVAMIGIAIQEVADAANPYPYIGGGYYPVEG